MCKEMLLKMDDVHLMLWAAVVFIASMSLQVPYLSQAHVAFSLSVFILI